MHESPGQTKPLGFWVALLVGFCLVIHMPVLGFSFVYDDHWTVEQNAFPAHVENASALFDGTAFKQHVPDAERPIMVLSVMVDRCLFGLSPTGHHLQSVLWHVVNMLLVAWLVLRLTDNRRHAFFAGFVFAVLPAHAEAASVVSYREDLLALLFVLLALLSLLHRRMHALALLFVFLGMLAKESAGVAFLFWPVVWWIKQTTWPGASGETSQKPSLASLKCGFCWIGIGLGLALLTRFFMAQGIDLQAALPVEIPDRGGFFVALSGLIRTLLIQFLQLFVPIQLDAVHPDMPGQWPFCLEWIVLLGLCTTIVWYAKKIDQRIFVGSILFVLMGFAPLLMSWRIPNLWVDRFLYLPSMGAAMWIGGMLAKYAFKNTRSLVVVALLTITSAFLHYVTEQRFRSDQVIWTRAMQHAPNSARTYEALASFYFQQREMKKSADVVKQGRDLFPDHSGLLSLSATHACLGHEAEEAEKLFAKAGEKTGIRNTRIFLKQGFCALHLQRPIEALRFARLVLNQTPYVTDAHLLRALSLHALGRIHVAKDALRATQDLDPDRTDIKMIFQQLYKDKPH